MPNNNLQVLITRPEKQGRALVKKLLDHGVTTIGHPMFDYQVNTSLCHIDEQLALVKNPILIFVSAAAVEYAHKIRPLTTWKDSQVVSVGSATQTALRHLGINSLCPTQHDSEGLLKLLELTQLDGQDVIIVRGNGGRELIADELRQRGACVRYLETYQRVWREVNNSTIDYWRQAQINCIVTTSNAILERMVQLIDTADNYWKNDCLWVVVSNRIAQRAKQLGLNHIVNANGANDEAIIAALLKHGTGS